MSLRIGSLCSGYGGLDAGVQSVLGGTVAWHSDIDPGASKILAHHWPGVPNHGDLTTTDWAMVEPVDAITAGWPCQPWSLAGKGRGKDDERAIWPAIADAVRHLRPRYVILENVAAVVVLGELARAVSDLAGLGYVGSWRCLRASDVGAPHGRNRCFIAATDTSGGGFNGGAVQLGGASGHAAGNCPAATDTAHIGHQRAGQSRNGWAGPADSGSVAPDTNGNAVRDEPVGQSRSRCAALAQHDVQWGQYAPAIYRWEMVLGRVAPPPTEPGRTGNPRLSPRFVEFLMGLPVGHVTDVPGLSRNEQLKALGNGVVPQQCAAALRVLLNAEEVAA